MSRRKVRRRSNVQIAAWKALSPRHRKLLLSHLPDDFERELNLRSSIMTACSNVFGPYQWDASVALLAEGEAEEVDRFHEEPLDMTLQEVGDALGGISKERVRSIQEQAMRKLRGSAVLQELLFGERLDFHHMEQQEPEEQPKKVHYYADLIDAAIERAKKTHPQ